MKPSPSRLAGLWHENWAREGPPMSSSACLLLFAVVTSQPHTLFHALPVGPGLSTPCGMQAGFCSLSWHLALASILIPCLLWPESSFKLESSSKTILNFQLGYLFPLVLSTGCVSPDGLSSWYTSSFPSLLVFFHF